MRILFVAPYVPAPGSGGRTRFTSILSRVSQRHDVEVLCFREHDQEASELTYPGRVLEPGPLKPRPGGLRGKVRFYGERLDPLPQFAALRFDREMVAAIREACTRFSPHVVQIETTEMGQYLRSVPYGPVRALDLQDVAHGWFERVKQQAAPGKQRMTMAWEGHRARRYDREIARRAEIVFVPSELEADRVATLAGVNPIVVENGVDTSFFSRANVEGDEPQHDPDRILFVGPLSYTANADGMRWFLDEVLPMVRMRVPNAYVAHVGHAGGMDLGERVRHLGRVSDLRPWYARSPVSIVPVRIGSGTRYKILEAFSMGGAVVSTTVGAEGLGAEHGQHLLVADDPRPFADALVKLLTDPIEREALGESGRALVEHRFDWDPLIAEMEDAWHQKVADLTTAQLEGSAVTSQE